MECKPEIIAAVLGAAVGVVVSVGCILLGLW